MKHIKTTTLRSAHPKQAMSTTTILTIVGSVFTGIGSILLAVSASIDPKVFED